MRVWLVTIGEPLPCDGPNERLLRTGIFAQHLAEHGHEVTWWTSTFDHVRKRHRFDGDTQLDSWVGCRLRMLHANYYSSNISFRRILNHRAVAQSFRQQAAQEARPDVIVCSWPTVELCVEAVRFGRHWGVPVVLDVRDLWPNAIADLVPRTLRPVARFALRGAFQRAHYAASRATAIVGITPQYVDWGLRFARRTSTSLDRHFPLGYVDRRPTEAEIDAARKFWAQYCITDDRCEFVACWIGMFGCNSEIATVIEASRQLERLGKSARFVLCGTGPELERCRRLAKDSPNILLPGWIDATQIWQLLRIASVGLAPYVSSDNYVHNLPNKPIEYLSAGLPILSSLQGALADLLAENDCGITYPNRSPEALAGAIAAIMDDLPRRQKMADNALSLYETRFVADKVYSAMRVYLGEVVQFATNDRAIATAERRFQAAGSKS